METEIQDKTFDEAAEILEKDGYKISEIAWGIYRAVRGNCAIKFYCETIENSVYGAHVECMKQG